MEDHNGPSLSEALTKFVAVKKGGKKAQDGHQELGRFVAWCGRERNVVDLSPSEVADYAQYIGLGGTDSASRLNPLKVFLAYLKDEGWIQTGLAAHLRIPRTRRNSNRGSGQGSDAAANVTRLSRAGYDRLVGQLDTLKVERLSIIEDIKRAMEDKDFRENAPLEAAKEQQGIIESRIRELESSLVRAEVWEEGEVKQKRKVVVVGAKITLKDVTSGKKVAYTLVDIHEADAAAGRISTESPVGKALLDRKVGEAIDIYVNDRLVARGEVVVVEDRLGVTMTEIVKQDRS